MNLRELAKGKDCLVRLPNVCNFNPETTVLAHIRNAWFSRGSKPPDICGVWSCSSCHDEIDRRTRKIDNLTLAAWVLDALCRQLHEYDKLGVLKW